MVKKITWKPRLKICEIGTCALQIGLLLFFYTLGSKETGVKN